MYAAQVLEFGQTPQWIEVPDEAAPAEGYVQVKVTAVSVPNIVRLRAAGKHYSAQTTPHTLGVDGVGEYLTGANKGQKCIFNALVAGKSFQTILNIPEQDTVPVPDTMNLLPLLGWVNPAASSMMALRERTVNLPKDFTVLILGVSSSSGQAAIDICRSYGAKTIFGAARNEKKMSELHLDGRIVLKEQLSEIQWGDISKVDLVLDYIWGPPALALLKALPAGHRTQFVTMGDMAGEEISLPISLLRSKDIILSGSGIGSVSFAQLRRLFPDLVAALLAANPREVRVAKIEDISKIWHEKDEGRLILTIDH